jgi:hypothetical protein
VVAEVEVEVVEVGVRVVDESWMQVEGKSV